MLHFRYSIYIVCCWFKQVWRFATRNQNSTTNWNSCWLFGAVLLICHFFFHRSVVVPVKKPPPGSLAVTTVGAATAGSGLPPGSTPNIFAATGATPKSMINTTGIVLKYFCDPHFFLVFFFVVIVLLLSVVFCFLIILFVTDCVLLK